MMYGVFIQEYDHRHSFDKFIFSPLIEINLYTFL
jgi:hypothetical protein